MDIQEEEEIIKRIQSVGYELVNRTSSRLFFHFKTEEGVSGEVMELVNKIGVMVSILPIKGKHGYSELCISRREKEVKYE